MSIDNDKLDRMIAELEARLKATGDDDRWSPAEILAEASRIVDAAEPDNVAATNQRVGEILEKHGIMPENPSASG